MFSTVVRLAAVTALFSLGLVACTANPPPAGSGGGGGTSGPAQAQVSATSVDFGPVGCGEAPWSAHLQALRPGIRYAGFDPSDYAVEQFGASRNVRQGSFGGLGELGIRERFDLLICADVLHYLDEEEIRRGLPVAARLIRGAAFFEVMTAEDDVIGDTLGLRRRPAQWYRDLFTAAGLTQVGPYLWIGDDLRARASPLEL